MNQSQKVNSDPIYTPNPDDPAVMDVHLWVGKENYSVLEAYREYKDRGISKHISITSIPDGLEPGQSRIFLSHAEAILEVSAPGATLGMLLETLMFNGAFTEDEYDDLWSPDLDNTFWNTADGGLQPGDFVPDQMLSLVMGLESLENPQALINAFEIKFHPGVFGYGYLTRIEYVCKDNEDELPDNLKHLEGYVTPVIVRYDEEDNNGKTST